MNKSCTCVSGTFLVSFITSLSNVFFNFGTFHYLKKRTETNRSTREMRTDCLPISLFSCGIIGKNHLYNKFKESDKAKAFYLYWATRKYSLFRLLVYSSGPYHSSRIQFACKFIADLQFSTFASPTNRRIIRSPIKFHEWIANVGIYCESFVTNWKSSNWMNDSCWEACLGTWMSGECERECETSTDVTLLSISWSLPKMNYHQTWANCICFQLKQR